MTRPISGATDRAARAVALVTACDVREAGGDRRTMSVTARHEALLDDGRRVLLLDGRGWTASLRTARLGAEAAHAPDSAADAWETTSVEEIERTAQAVVGPDEPYGDRSQRDMEAGHWRHLAGILARAGIAADARDLERLPHEVVLSERLRARLGGSPG